MRSSLVRTLRIAPYAWFFLLAGVVLGPLLKPGYLLLLDAPAGPNPNWPSLLPTPSEGQVAQAAPSLAVHHLLALVHPHLPNKLAIALVVIVGGIGMYRFLYRALALRKGGAVVGATFFVVNPYVYDRMLAGQILLLLGYAGMAWALPRWLRIIQSGARNDVLRGLGWCAVITLVDIHFGGMALLLFVLAIVFSPVSLVAKVALVAMGILGLLVINSYWLIPSLLTEAGGRLGTGDFRAYSPRPRSARILPTVLALHGFWRLEFPTPLSLYPSRFWATFLPLVGSSIYGLLRAAGSRKWLRPSTALGIACLIALILGMGGSFPLTASFPRWLFENFPGYGIYREPQKWIGLLALGYTVFTAVGVDGLAALMERARPMVGNVVALAAVLPLVASSTMLWGFGNRVETSQFPDDWLRAQEETAGKGGAVMILPWNHYQPLPFAGFRIVANPAHHFFTSPAIISDDAQLFVSSETPPADPRDVYVEDVLKHRRRLTAFGHLIAPLGIRFVAVPHVADWRSYGFLQRQSDLRPVFSGDAMTLYENTAYAGHVYALSEANPGALTIGDRLGSGDGEENVLNELEVLTPPQTTKPLPGPGWAEGLPGWERVQAAETAFVGTDASCLDGWRLGPEEPACHLGAVAAFESPNFDARLWRPGVAVQLGAYALSVIAAGVLVFGIVKTELK